MARPLSFLHTSSLHIQPFNALLAERAPDIPVRHVVDESLLSEACASGGVTPALRKRVEEILLTTVEEQDAAVMVCTCSSIGSVAEAVNARTHATLMRIDRPMAGEAGLLGSPLFRAPPFSTTLVPTPQPNPPVAPAAG